MQPEIQSPINDRRAHEQASIPVNTAQPQQLRFGVEGRLANVQELDPSKVVMPDPRLRGGSSSRNHSSTRSSIRRQQLQDHLHIEALIEEVIAHFDELERHRDGSLLRQVLTRNERLRLQRLYRQLVGRFQRRMRGLGVDPAELLGDEDLL